MEMQRVVVCRSPNVQPHNFALFSAVQVLLAQEVEANNEVHQSIATKITQRRLGPTQESYHF